MESDHGVFDRELAKLAQTPIEEVFAYPESEDLSHLMDGAKTSLRRYRESQDDGSISIVFPTIGPAFLTRERCVQRATDLARMVPIHDLSTRNCGDIYELEAGVS